MPAAERPIPPSIAGLEPLDDADLDSVVAAAIDPEDLEPSERARRFEVTDLGSAEWCMRHVRAIAARTAEAKALARQWHAEVDQWLEDSIARDHLQSLFFEAHLEGYALQLREADPKAKTLNLPSGKVTTTSSTPKVICTDDEDLAVFLAEHYSGDELAERGVVKWTAKVYLDPLRELLEVATVTDVDDDGNEVVARYAVTPVDPTTGEPWEDGVNVEDRQPPGAAVSEPSTSAKVVPAPVLT